MKIHITGMSPRMVSDRARAKISFSSLLTNALRSNGHEVARDAELHEDAEVVMVGLSSVLSPASSYSITALGILGRALAESTPVLLYVDDPSVRDIRDSIASVRRDPDRLWSDFLAPKRVLASENYDRDTVMAAIDLLGGDQWPTMLAPFHSWGKETTLSRQLKITTDIISIDPSGLLLDQMQSTPWHRPRDARIWLCEQNYSPCAIGSTRTTWPVMRTKNAAAWGTVSIYGTARAVTQDALRRCLGWWTPTPLFAAYAGSVYLTSIEESTLIGGPYYLTIEQVEAMSTAEHHVLAADQYEHIKGVSWDQTTLISQLEVALGQNNSSSTQATTRMQEAT